MCLVDRSSGDKLVFFLCLSSENKNIVESWTYIYPLKKQKNTCLIESESYGSLLTRVAFWYQRTYRENFNIEFDCYEKRISCGKVISILVRKKSDACLWKASEIFTSPFVEITNITHGQLKQRKKRNRNEQKQSNRMRMCTEIFYNKQHTKDLTKCQMQHYCAVCKYVFALSQSN